MATLSRFQFSKEYTLHPGPNAELLVDTVVRRLSLLQASVLPFIHLEPRENTFTHSIHGRVQYGGKA
jgi:hypothetical protein